MSHLPPPDFQAYATRWFKRTGSALNSTEQRVLASAVRREALTRSPHQKLDEQTTFGQRLADKVAQFGGSWAFILLFGAVLAAWVVLNTEVLGRTAFDPYPYIFLNLMLSMLAAIQAPVIMMSQNRLSTKDRQMAAYDYEVNLKAEIEIMALHEKLDALRTEQLMTLIQQQQTQIALLTRLVEGRGLDPATAAP